MADNTEPRRYGQWSGNNAGTAEDPRHCIEEVSGRHSQYIPGQCSRKRGHGPGGLYCYQHGKMADEGRVWMKPPEEAADDDAST